MSRETRDRLQRAFVLHRRDYSDTSLLLEVFTEVNGRLALLAKGAKRPRGAAAVLQPFTPLLIGWSGRGEVGTLVRAEAHGRPLPLPGDALYCGFYVNELLLRLLQRQDPHERLFDHYRTVLEGLAGGDLDTVLRHFELRLLGEVGYAPELGRDADAGTPVRADRCYVYRHEHGLVPAAPSSAQPVVSGETLRRLSAGEPLRGVHAREARALLRGLLAPHLGERPLRSRELLAARVAARARPAAAPAGDTVPDKPPPS